MNEPFIGVPSPPPHTFSELVAGSLLHLAFAAVLLRVLHLWWLRTPEIRRPLQAFGVGAVLIVCAWAAFDPRAIPIDLLVPLHEGGTREVMYHLYGRTVHGSFGFHTAMRWVAEADAYGLRRAVAANAMFHGVASLGFATLTWVVCRSPLAVGVLTALFAVNRVAINAVLSESPGSYLALLAVAMVPCALLLRPDEDARHRRWGWGATALWTVLCAAARPEMAMPGLGILFAAAVYPWLTPWVPAFQRVLWFPVASVLSLVRPIEVPKLKNTELASLLALVVAGWFFWSVEPEWRNHVDLPRWLGRWNWFYVGLAPGNPSIGYLPWLLLHAAPVGALVFVGAAVGRTVAEPRWYGFLPLSLLVLFRSYMSAGHWTWWEYLRYATMFFPFLLVLLPLGWQELSRWPRVRTAALLALLVPWPGLVQDVGTSGFLLSRNLQREARAMAHELEANPTCVLLVPFDAEQVPEGPPGRWEVGLASMRMPEPMWTDTVPDDPAALVARAMQEARLETEPDCIRVWRSLDCHQRGATCPDFGVAAPRQPVTWQNLEWADFHVGPHEAQIAVGASPLP